MSEKKEENKKDEKEDGKKKKPFGKNLLHFEGKILPIFGIEKVEREERWNDIREAMEYLIVINREIPLGSSSVVDMEFIYQNQEYREIKFEELKNKLSIFPFINII